MMFYSSIECLDRQLMVLHIPESEEGQLELLKIIGSDHVEIQEAQELEQNRPFLLFGPLIVR